MAGKTMASTPPVGVAAQPILHAAREIRLGRPEKGMKVVRHQDVAEQFPAVPLHRRFEPIGKPLAVAVIAHNVLAPVSTGHDMIDRAAEFNAQRSGHGGKLPLPTALCKPEKRINRSDP